VPSLIVPANTDQILVAQQAQALGIGHSLWRPGGLPIATGLLDKMTSTQIRHEIDNLIADQDCVRTCAVLKREIEASHGAAAAIEILKNGQKLRIKMRGAPARV